MTLVYAYVCADILHEGHLLHLENAKKLGDKLIVGVLTDEAVMEQKQKPVLSFRERIKIVQALKCVDCAIPQNTYSPVENVIALQPDIVMESSSHLGQGYLDDLRKLVKGRIVMMPYYEGQSSTAIKKKIVEEWRKNIN